jgi:glutamate transport system permease protein
MSTAVLYDAVGPRGRRRIVLQSIIGGLVILALLAVVIWRLEQQGQFEAERWEVLTESDVQQALWRGLQGTLKAAAVAMLLSLVIGALLAVGRLSHRIWIRIPATVLVEFFRGLPLLLLILFIYLGAPTLGLDLTVFWALVAGLTLYNSAVIGEIFRAGILSLPKGQTEAAYAVGLRRGQTLRLVLIPQAVRRMLPALISQLVTLLKDTSLGFVIAYVELLRTGRNIVEFLGGEYSLQVYTAVAVIYIAVNMTLSFVARWVDRRTERRYGRTVEVAAADEAA